MDEPTSIHDLMCRIENAFIRSFRDVVALRESSLAEGTSMTIEQVYEAAEWLMAHREWLRKESP